MPMKISRAAYADMFGPTTGDKVRLADTDLVVEVENAAYGVGRIVRSLPGCRVLCVYLRGERQHGYTDLPARGDRLWVSLSPLLEPKSDHAGLRGSRDVARQIAARLSEMEQAHFARLEARGAAAPGGARA